MANVPNAILNQKEREVDGVITGQLDFAHNGRTSMGLKGIGTITTLFHKPCHLQPYTDRVEELGTAFKIEGERFEGEAGYYMVTYIK